nr:MAG TPA: hypothetical protein [Caudoviricetes sp.]
MPRSFSSFHYNTVENLQSYKRVLLNEKSEVS